MSGQGESRTNQLKHWPKLITVTAYLPIMPLIPSSFEKQDLPKQIARQVL